MMKTYIYLLLFLSFISCTSDKQSIEDAISERIGSKIHLPDSVNVIHVGDPKMMRSTDFLNPKLNTFAIIVDAECEKCIEKLAKVDTFIQSLNREINVLVFMNTSNPEYFLRYIYKDIVFSYPLILNKNYEYEKLNKITADKQFLYALLLNSKQEIVVVGNPTYSHELEKLYRKKLNEI